MDGHHDCLHNWWTGPGSVQPYKKAERVHWNPPTLWPAYHPRNGYKVAMGWLGGNQVPLVPDVSAVATTINVQPADRASFSRWPWPWEWRATKKIEIKILACSRGPGSRMSPHSILLRGAAQYQ